jgi:hypothetical protein
MLIRSGLPVEAPLRAWWLPDSAGWSGDSVEGASPAALKPRELALELAPELELELELELESRSGAESPPGSGPRRLGE